MKLAGVSKAVLVLMLGCMSSIVVMFAAIGIEQCIYSVCPADTFNADSLFIALMLVGTVCGLVRTL